jgi:acyl dehydratase
VIQHDFPRDPDARHFEDYPPGLTVQTDSIGVDERAIIDFGRQFDPQPFHVEPASDAAQRLGGVIASGWHTASLMMRLLVEHFLPRAAGLASPGIDELRWLVPVRPGDQLHIRVTVTEARPSRSKPDRGAVHSFIETLNQRGETVMTVKTMTLMRCRAAPTAANSS